VARIYLSPPDVGPDERELLLDAFDSNWIAPLGPHVDAFERELADAAGTQHAVALSSGTAALHLALLLAGVERDDEVLVSTLTFVATANPVRYIGARPVFVDSDWTSWNLDPALVAQYLDDATTLPKAIVSVDLYGQCADYDALRAACAKHGVALIEDAAEALGATYRGQAAGSLGDIGVLSFNGNKIATTSGGGALTTDDAAVASRARHLATQAREPVVHYEHVDVGFNYRMSNLLAAVGRGQLRSLAAKVDRRRQLHAQYRAALGDMPGIEFMPEADFGRATRWLTVALVDRRDEIIKALDAEDIEARPAWMPMHRQPAYADSAVLGGAVADAIFARGICLPSGSGLTDAEQQRVIDVMQGAVR
jgi:dTDP-4-amino-4,6-dideoxygalactose transaminase